MIVNIEQEYNNHLRNVWEKFSGVTKDILQPRQESEHTYEVVSLSSIEFLHDKLESSGRQES